MRFYTRNIKLILLWLILYFISINRSLGQSNYQLPPNQPEQDACNALQLCGGAFFTPYSYTGVGRKLDLNSTPCSLQPGGGEMNSVWLELRVATAGNVLFKIKPVNPGNDYNFAVLDVTGKDCSSLMPGDVIRCDYNLNTASTSIDGATGLSDTSKTRFILANVVGWAFCAPVFAKAGDVLLIMVNNSGNNLSGSQQGFTLDFDGSTATFFNTANPHLSTVDEQCNDTKSIIIKTNTQVLCSSIAADGSDFATNAPASIVSAYGVNCTDRGGYTNSIVINFSSSLPGGSYAITPKKGSDNTTLKGLCGNELLLPDDPIPFIIKPGSKVFVDEKFICSQQMPYTWNNMQITTEGDGVASYTTASAAGCDSTTILNLHVALTPQQKNFSEIICDGDSYILPWDSTVNTAGMYSHHFANSNGCDSLVENVTLTVFVPPSGSVQVRDSTYQMGFCQGGSLLLDPGSNFTSYLWNDGDTSQIILVNVAGTYGLNAKDQYGCTTIDTFVVAAYPRPTADFGTIVNICADSPLLLNGGTGYSAYLWDDGSTNQTFTADKPGTYWVRLTDSRNCTAIDTVHVVKVEIPANFLTNSVSKCAGAQVVLTPSNNFEAYKWSNGKDTRSIDVSSPGLYWLQVTNRNECTGRDSTTVIDEICPEYFFVPKAFTPNNDGHNDLFRPRFAGTVSKYHFFIYNRWGELIYASYDAFAGWDGTAQGARQPAGIYVWICTYSLNGRPTQTERGTVALIR